MSSEEAVKLVNDIVDSAASTPLTPEVVAAIGGDAAAPEEVNLAALKRYIRKNIADIVVSTAFRMGSDDNITVLVKWLDGGSLAKPWKRLFSFEWVKKWRIWDNK